MLPFQPLRGTETIFLSSYYYFLFKTNSRFFKVFWLLLPNLLPEYTIGTVDKLADQSLRKVSVQIMMGMEGLRSQADVQPPGYGSGSLLHLEGQNHDRTLNMFPMDSTLRLGNHKVRNRLLLRLVCGQVESLSLLQDTRKQ